MEQAVEATAVEVERIGEGQRFLTRLFTEGEGSAGNRCWSGTAAREETDQVSRAAALFSLRVLALLLPERNLGLVLAEPAVEGL